MKTQSELAYQLSAASNTSPAYFKHGRLCIPCGNGNVTLPAMAGLGDAASEKNKCLAYKGAAAVGNKAWSLRVVVPLQGVDDDAHICSQMGWHSLNTCLESYLGKGCWMQTAVICFIR